MSLQHIQKNSPRLLPKPAKFEKNPPNGYRVIRKTKCGAGGARSSPIHKQASLAGRLINCQISSATSLVFRQFLLYYLFSRPKNFPWPSNISLVCMISEQLFYKLHFRVKDAALDPIHQLKSYQYRLSVNPIRHHELNSNKQG